MIPDSERFQSVADGSDLATPAPWPPTDAECLAVLLKARALGFIVKPDVHPRLIRVKPPKDSDSYSHDYVRALFRCSAGIRRLLLKESPPLRR
ncbi:MAG: hypothetical protein JO355_15655, partial [Planctomycetaceae bacterium]|nr:hypothetical protein [Planctomycetaceae bacterium]